MGSILLSLSVGALSAIVAYNEKPLFTTERSLYFGGVTVANAFFLRFSPLTNITAPIALGAVLFSHTVMLGIGCGFGHIVRNAVKE